MREREREKAIHANYCLQIKQDLFLEWTLENRQELIQDRGSNRSKQARKKEANFKFIEKNSGKMKVKEP